MQALAVTADNLTAAITRELLEDLGSDVTVLSDVSTLDVPNGLDPYQLIIVDWSLEAASSFCHRASEYRSGQSPVLIAVARRLDAAARDAARNAGVDDVIALDMNHALLFQRLLHAASRVTAGGTPEPRADPLQQDDPRFRALVPYARDITTILSPDGAILHESPSVTHLLGYPKNSLTGANAFDFIHADDLPAAQSAFHRLIENPSQPVSARYRFRHIDGTWRWLDTVGINAMADPSVGGILANSCDVTDQLTVESQLHDSIARYRDLFASAARQTQELELLEKVRVALARVMDLKTVIRTAINATEAAFGYRLISAYLLDGDFLNLQHQCGYEHVISRVPLTNSVSGRVIRTGVPVLLKDAHADPDFLAAIDGLVSEVCAPIFDQGRVVGMLNVESSDGMALDENDLRLVVAISEHLGIAVTRARLFDESRISDDRFHAAFNNAPTGMALMLADGCFLQVNETLGAMMGRSSRELLATDFFSLVRGRDRSRLRRRIERLQLAESTQEQVEVVIEHANGGKLWANVGISRVQDGVGHEDYFIVQAEDTSERKALLARLEHQAMHDPLTGLPNRTKLTERLESAIATRVQGTLHPALLLIDLDGFKLINDSFGHEAGDEFLVAAARRLKNALRGDDLIARLGGDEFAVLLYDVSSADDAERAADRLLHGLQAPFRVQRQDAFISASVGITVATQVDATPASILRQADIALYRAKDAGRGTYVTFNPRMTAPVPRGLKLERQLQDAINAGHVEVAYQPQIDLRTGRITGVEALARVADAAQGYYLPGDFLALAEQTGLILPIGWEVLERACAAWCHWPTSPQTMAPVLTVNFSAQQLQQPEIEQRIARALKRTGMDPTMLQIEVPERSWSLDPGTVLDVVDRLRAMGVRFAIDDFGAEVASLLHALTPRVDALSISPTLLATFQGQLGGSGFVRSLGNLAHERGLVLTAKAIETREQLASARALEIDQGQGYHLAPPMSSSQLSALLGDDHHVDMNESPLRLVQPEQPTSSIGA